MSLDQINKKESLSPFNWQGKTSSLLTGKDKQLFNGVNHRKSVNASNNRSEIGTYTRAKDKNGVKIDLVINNRHTYV
jgi:hypothetical protein